MIAAKSVIKKTTTNKQQTSLYVSFLSWVKTNSTNWPPINVRVFIAQFVKHCSAKAEIMVAYPVEDPQFFSG